MIAPLSDLREEVGAFLPTAEATALVVVDREADELFIRGDVLCRGALPDPGSDLHSVNVAAGAIDSHRALLTVDAHPDQVRAVAHGLGEGVLLEEVFLRHGSVLSCCRSPEGVGAWAR